MKLELEQLVCCPLSIFAHVFCLLTFDKIYLSTEFWLEWLLLLFKSFINNDMRTFGLSQYVAVSVTEVSDVDLDVTEALLMLIIYQQRSPIDCLLVLVIITDHVDIGWTQPSCERILIQMIIELTFLMQHTGSRICYLSLRKAF